MDISGWTAHWGTWTPDKTALQFEGRSISYAELERAVALTAARLLANGVSPGDRVGYLGPNCPELLQLLFACARLGAIFVPLNARMPPAELRVFVALTRPRLLIAEQDLHRAAIDSADDGVVDRVLTFAIASELLGPTGDVEPTAADPAADPARLVLIAFTSGTTGRPKGATFSHENITFNAFNGITAFGLTGEDEILTAVPMFHAGGLLIHTTPGLCAGATITIHRQFDPGMLLGDVARRRITLLASVPAMTFALSAHPGWEKADLSSLRCVVTGSTVVSRRAIDPWQRKGVPIVQVYGLTETCPIVTTMPPNGPKQAALTAGKPVLYHQIRIVDESGCDAGVGEQGEIWIRGPSMMQGYWEHPQATREAFCDGWMRTGDLGLLDDDGYLHVVDRIKDIIIVGGSNVYPSDLQAVLGNCADIREAAVIGRPDNELGEVPVACVVLVVGQSLTPEQVSGLFEDRLAAYKHPRDVIFLDALPRNPTGKVDRTRLHELVDRSSGISRSSSRSRAGSAIRSMAMIRSSPTVDL